MSSVGKILGNRYEIIEEIGSGGMATVYKAKCHVLNRYVAVKVLRDEFTTDEEFVNDYLPDFINNGYYYESLNMILKECPSYFKD